jgi:hypothetical protein
MELPEQFKKNYYIIEVIRHFINPNFLKTKEECLRFYARNHFNTSPYLRSYDDIIDTSQYLGASYNRYGNSNKSIIYDITKCCVIEGEIEKQLDENQVYELLNKCGPTLIFKILKTIVFPNDKIKEYLIEEENQRKIYPIDKTQLLEVASIEFVRDFAEYFVCTPFDKKYYTKMMTINNKYNVDIIQIPKDLFNQYCHITTLIQNTNEKIKQITIPFEFTFKVGQQFLKCLINGYLCIKDIDNEQDFNQLKQLISYLQVSFVKKK